MIVDCHTHWSHNVGEPGDPTRFIAVMKSHNVTHAAIFPVLGLCDDTQIKADHDDIAVVCQKSGGMMLPFCTAAMWNTQYAIDEVNRCLGRLGFRGIKLHPWLQGFSLNMDVMDLICELAESFDVPIFFHDGTPPFSLPSQVGMLARRHPRVKLVLGHCGLFDMWREAITVLNTEPNLYGCICGPYPAAIKEIINNGPTDRLVWGSDYGFSAADVYDYRLDMFERIGIESGRRTMIFEDNARRLLRCKSLC